MNKITSYKVGQEVEFYFLENKYTGVVMEVAAKDGMVLVKTKDNIRHRVGLTEKESKFCYFKKN
jgi:hypothetical protein